MSIKHPQGMRKVRKELKTYEISAECTNCGGTLQPSCLTVPDAVLSGALLTVHVCDKCGAEVHLAEQYPQVEHVWADTSVLRRKPTAARSAPTVETPASAEAETGP